MVVMVAGGVGSRGNECAGECRGAKKGLVVLKNSVPTTAIGLLLSGKIGIHLPRVVSSRRM